MTADIEQLLANHLRYERAIAAAKRYLSRELREQRTVSTADVRAFLRRRRDRLPDEVIAALALRIMREWVNSRANRYRGPDDDRHRDCSRLWRP